MKINRNQLLMILLAAGFFVGILYANHIKLESKIFDSAIMDCYKLCKIDNREYLLYVVKERAEVLIVVLFLGQVRWKQIYAGLATWIAGAMFGGTIYIAFHSMGIKGLFLCIVGMFPHMLLYGLGYWIVVNYWMEGSLGRWKSRQTWGVLIFMLLGIVCEVYINPFLFRLFL